ncbi:MAG: DUF4493 domain-containing protein [Tannerellaceae bacterium]|nr:DUF4493 domain-containing protein [Tannerellaceae bacterium]
MTAVSVECKYQSVGVEIQLTDVFLNNFHDTYTVTVQQDMEGASAVYSKSNSDRIYFTKDCNYFLKLTIECTNKNNYPLSNPYTYVYYLNKDAEDPLFNQDAPYKGEYFIVAIGTDQENEITVRSTLVQ